MHWILFITYILMILGVIFIERKKPTEALLWVTVLICLPYLGALLYLIFGSTFAIKLTSKVRKMRLDKSMHLLPAVRKVHIQSDTLTETDQRVVHFNSVYNQSRLTSYDTSEIFTCGKDHYAALFRDIKSAKECIYVEFYTIHHDVVGQAFVNALAEKASEGVTVLVMCDFIANLSTPKSMFQPLMDAGGRVIRLKPYLTHYRSHRKIVAIDHKISYIGGMNIGKQYADMHKKKTPWRDTQVRLTGACTAELESDFFTDWLCAVCKRDWNDTLKYISGITRPTYPLAANPCQFIVGGVDNDKESAKMCYLSMIQSAKKRIRIQTPYFIPDSSILDALKTAAATGIEIELMIPGVSSSFFLEPVTTYYAGQLLEYGAKVYQYNGYIHAKTMVIDEELCCIGSVNMDIRSLMVDDEVCGVFYSNSLVKQYSDIFTHDITHCTEYTWEKFSSRSGKERAKESIFLLFAPLM